jgi:hypothetical protein
MTDMSVHPMGDLGIGRGLRRIISIVVAFMGSGCINDSRNLSFFVALFAPDVSFPHSLPFSVHSR